ncbi:hypothetical protein ACFQJ7_09970 [Halovenus rubra]|uniref:Uncharacterized protein n=2 Tax=Halovenus rubra TaxID=869890 RepID=A0ACC7DWR2_9EURY|nr:hypothetical protein [Halovenus rubra]
MPSTDEYTFALCLSHDVDRVYKTYQYISEAISEPAPRKLPRMVSGKNPWWQFERIMSLERDLGVRSSFNILDEQPITSRPKRELITKKAWRLFAGRYDVTDPQFRSILEVLQDGGWEIGLQGSYHSSDNPERFEVEKENIERSVNVELLGNRQHYLRLNRPDTWRSLRDIGIRYDTSLADKYETQPQFGYELIRPFDDEFVVFPWTLMDVTAMESSTDFSTVLANCERLLENFQDKRSVLVLDWHQRVFYRPGFPHWAELYEELIQRAQEMGAWVGPPGEFYEAVPHPDGTVADALDRLDDP